MYNINGFFTYIYGILDWSRPLYFKMEANSTSPGRNNTEYRGAKHLRTARTGYQGTKIGVLIQKQSILTNMYRENFTSSDRSCYSEKHRHH